MSRCSGAERQVQIIDAGDFCSFVKNYGRELIGNRLTNEGLAFARDYVFPRSHADLLSVRRRTKRHQRCRWLSRSCPI